MVTKIHIAAGTAYNFCRPFAALAQKKLGEIREQLMNAKMLYTDATVMGRVNNNEFFFEKNEKIMQIIKSFSKLYL